MSSTAYFDAIYRYIKEVKYMDTTRSLFKHEMEIVDYGNVKVKLAELLQKKGITRNRLRTLTDLKYGIIDRYYKAQDIVYVDLGFLAKVCFVLNCQISDLLEYQPPEQLPDDLQDSSSDIQQEEKA